MCILLKILDVTDEPILANPYIGKNGLLLMFNNASISFPENLYFFIFFLLRQYVVMFIWKYTIVV